MHLAPKSCPPASTEGKIQLEGSEIRGSSEAVLLTPRSGLDIYLAHEKRPCPRPRPRKRFRFRIRFRFRFPGSPDRIFTSLRRGDSFIFARGSVGPGSLETFRGRAPGIGATVGTSIYIYMYIYIYLFFSRIGPPLYIPYSPFRGPYISYY